MKKEIAEMWVEALRSGKYKQGKSKLKSNDDLYCCLGVLCEISELSKWSEENNYYFSSCGMLPVQVQIWAGMNSFVGKLSDKNTLWYLNDGTFGIKQHSFEEIANIIEKNWEEL